MRHSQRRRLQKKEREFLEGSETESSRYRHAVLTWIREMRLSGELLILCLCLVLMATLKQRADYLAAAGAVVAVVGVIRFRTGYVERIKRNNSAFQTTLPDGRDDTLESEARMSDALTVGERSGIAFAAAGTLINGFSGWLGHTLGWIN